MMAQIRKTDRDKSRYFEWVEVSFRRPEGSNGLSWPKKGTAEPRTHSSRSDGRYSYLKLEVEAVTVFERFEERANHLCIRKIAIESIEFVQPEIEST